MKKFILYCLSFIFWQNSFAQDTLAIDSVEFELVKKIEKPIGLFTADKLGYIYISNGDQLSKYNSNGEVLFEQSYKNLGDISHIDATQSLRTLLFYRDLTQIVFVDNTLSIQGESIKLEKEGYSFVTLTCASFMNNHFWIYSTDEFMIKRLDKQLNEIALSGNLVQVTGKELNPSYLVESGDHVYLYDSLQGILQFDLFGTYIQTIPITGISSFQVEDETILYLEGGNLIAYSLKDFSLAKLVLPNQNIIQFRKSENRLTLAYKDRLELYQLKQRK